MSIENVLCTHSIIIHGIYTLVIYCRQELQAGFLQSWLYNACTVEHPCIQVVEGYMKIQLPQCMAAVPVVAKVVATGGGISAELQGKCGDMAS